MSIKKIAEMAGVSPATVSRVLNNPNYRCSSEDVRDRIWKVAMELNYVPNEAARNLKKGIASNAGKTYYINVLMTRMDDLQTDPFFTELLHCIESEVHAQVCILSRVWYMSMFSNDKKCNNADLKKIIGDMHRDSGSKCDGLIIIGKCNKKALKILKECYRNVVSVNRNSTNYEVDEVVCDGAKVAATAVEYLLKLGHAKIAYVGSCQNESRYKGFLEVLNKNGIERDPNYVIETNQTEAEGFDAMKRILKLDSPPTGIYCANDITAIGMLKCLSTYKSAYYTPAIIASDDIAAAQNVTPMLTTVSLPKEEMGKFALYILLDRIKGGHKGNVRIEVEGRLVVRNSCAKPANMK